MTTCFVKFCKKLPTSRSKLPAFSSKLAGILGKERPYLTKFHLKPLLKVLTLVMAQTESRFILLIPRNKGAAKVLANCTPNKHGASNVTFPLHN